MTDDAILSYLYHPKKENSITNDNVISISLEVKI